MASQKLKQMEREMREIDPSLDGAKISFAELYMSTLTVRVGVICENTVGEAAKSRLLSFFNDRLPRSFKKIVLEVKKVRADGELVTREICDRIHAFFPSVAYSITRDDIAVNMPILREKGGQFPLPITFTVTASADMKEQFERLDVVGDLERFLGRKFCNEFEGGMKYRETETDFSILEPEPPDVDYINYRTIKVRDLVKIDDIIGADTAVYIDDIRGPMDSIYLCGEILSVRERAASNGKPFYLIEFSDRSGKIVGTYFNKKATEDKIKRLKEGDGIFVQGSLDYFRDYLSLTIKKINYCTFPKDFVPERRISRKAPSKYSVLFPQKIKEYLQKDMFAPESKPLPQLMGKTVVVFDFETTGKDPFKAMVTEIGAVKIVDGVMTEVLSTLVNPGEKIPPDVTGLTGITDDMVADKPPFSKISGDIFKFFDGAILVGQNVVGYDIKILRRLSEPDEYYYYNPVSDTLLLARKVIPGLRNYKLETIAEHLGIEYDPHRAVDDAYATAKVFIKLVEILGKFPDYDA